ncbi:MAG: hypothetical protein II882_07835 [Lachnospiraceae bacterium]|nr:hypothetical protein [Lachnospiraceae bacterium]
MHARKFICALMLLSLLLCLAACGKQPSTTEGSNTDSTVQPSAPQTSRSSSEEHSSETEESTEDPLSDYPFEPTVTGIYLTREGKIQSAEVSSFDDPHYDKKTLLDFIADVVGEYNAAKGIEAVSIVSLEVADKKATLVLSYDEISHFMEFQGSDFNVSLIKVVTTEEAARDYTLTNLMKPDGTKVSAFNALKDEQQKVLIIKGDTSVTVNGDITALSKSFTVTGPNSARVSTETECFIFFK